ncbi:hypothetical protein GGX14DRAFT_395854 [Mycena pura]|uniref:Uncharacterized protein n=1 Tax=Mycena pura TaxID=153505 RepID=A0AAD6YE01_9AGAR|nr:hypothetical protein GGX14DRAFT_395854 [Mycena pura]
MYLPSLRQEEYARQRTESGKRKAVGGDSDAVCGGLQNDGYELINHPIIIPEAQIHLCFLDIEEQYRSLYEGLKLTRTAGALKFRLPATSAELLQSMPRSRSPVTALTYYYGSSSVFSEVDGLKNLHVTALCGT